MYKPEKRLPNTPVLTCTADKIYFVDKHDDIVEIDKGSFFFRTILPRRQQAAMLFPRRDDLVIYADDKVFIESEDGTVRQIAEHVTPIATFSQGIVCGEYIDDKAGLTFINNAGDHVWKVDIHASYRKLALGNALFFCAFDQHFNEVYHLIHKVDISTGVLTVLIDLNKHFGDDPAFKSIAYLEYYFLFSYDHVVVCLINGYKIVGIDADAGTILWEISEITDRDGNKLDGFISGPLEGGIYNDKYYFLRGKILFCIDVANRKLNLLCSIEGGIQITRCSIYGSQMFFTGEDMVERKWNLLGVFDIDRSEIVWQTVIDMPAGGFLPVKPCVDEKCIYLNDSENVLHVFRKKG